MVYLAHATTPVVFGILSVVYYFSIPVALIIWAYLNREYIKKGNYRLKRLAAYLLVAFFFTSLAAYEMTSIYFYLHSPMEGALCFTSSCVLHSAPFERYQLHGDGFEKLGLPAVGPMKVYRIYDGGTNATDLMPVLMNYVVVIRPMVFLPGAEVNVYYIKGHDAVSRKRFLVFWPFSPGGVLTKHLNVKFTVFVISGGGGPGA